MAGSRDAPPHAGLATPQAFARALVRFPVFALIVILACLAGRWVNVYACANLVNRYRRNPLNKAVNFMMWFSGLRGGVAFALSSAAKFVIPNR